MSFIHTLLVNVDKSKQNDQNQDTIHFEDAIYRVLHERRNFTAFFRGAREISRINAFFIRILGKCCKIKIKTTRIRTLYILELLRTGCSTKKAIKLLPSRSTWNLKDSRLLQMHFGLIVANKNKKTSIRTLYILKMLHTRCSTKEAIKLLPSRSTLNFKNKWLLHMHFRLKVAN